MNSNKSGGEKSKSRQIAVYKKLHKKENGAYIHPVTDWRRIFDEEIGCDFIIDVDGVYIKAHKTILESRCQYFAFMFSGNARNTCETAILDGFSTECVQFALCQIYSGDRVIPYNVDLFELADLADLLCFEGLKESVTNVLELEYFHSFHEPCDQCAVLVSRFLPWSGAIGYTEIYYKIIFWIKDYSDLLWIKPEFAQLPSSIIQKCFSYHSSDMESDNVLDTVQRCDRLMVSLPKATWTANVFRFALKLLRLCVQFIREHLVEVLSTESFAQLGNGDDDKSIQRLEVRLTAAIERASPAQLCSAYNQLYLLLQQQANRGSSMEWCELLTRLTIHCEDSLISCASEAMCTSAWTELLPELQERIQKSSGIMTASTYSKLAETVKKHCARDLCIERIRYILYSQLGSINRVHEKVPPILLPVPVISKSCITVPGNSMVSSTKACNLNNTSASTALPYKNNYKNVKSRYMNPKPARSSVLSAPPKIIPPAVVKSNKQFSKNNEVTTKKNFEITIKKNFEVSNKKNVEVLNKKIVEVSNKKIFEVSNKKIVSLSKTNNDAFCSPSDLNKGTNQALNKKVSRSEQFVGSQTRSCPPFRGKASAIAYVSPYSSKSSNTNKSLKTPPKFGSLNLYSTKTGHLNYLSTSVPDRVGFIDPKVSDHKLLRGSFSKSPTFKVSNESSSNMSSPLSQRSCKMATVHPMNRCKNEPSTLAKGKNIPKKEKYQSYSKSTLSSSIKMTKKTAFEPKDKIAKHVITNKSASEVHTRKSIADPQSSNVSSANFVLDRSRTFVKSEPSIISKDITMDSSIEMYPE